MDYEYGRSSLSAWLFEACAAKIRISRAQIQIFLLEFAEREYLRRSQRYEQLERKSKYSCWNLPSVSIFGVANDTNNSSANPNILNTH